MEKFAAINALLNARFDKSSIQVWQATVKSVEGSTCTVDILTTDLTVDEVRLRADSDATEGVLLVPRVGSLVLVGLIENELSELYICQASELDEIKGTLGKTSFDITTDRVSVIRDKTSLLLSGVASLKQDQTEVTLSQGKVSIKNSGVNLKDLFDGLTQLLQTFQVICAGPGAPSASVFPATLTSITQLKAKVSQLLS